MFWSVRLYKASCNQLAKAFGFGGVGGLFFLAVNWGFPGMDALFYGTPIYKWMRTGRTLILGNLQLYKITLVYQCKPQMVTSIVLNLIIILYLHMLFFPWKKTLYNLY